MYHWEVSDIENFIVSVASNISSWIFLKVYYEKISSCYSKCLVCCCKCLVCCCWCCCNFCRNLTFLQLINGDRDIDDIHKEIVKLTSELEEPELLAPLGSLWTEQEIKGKDNLTLYKEYICNLFILKLLFTISTFAISTILKKDEILANNCDLFLKNCHLL